MVVAALIMATGALAVALIDGRVPVFEIVVHTSFYASSHAADCGRHGTTLQYAQE